MAKPTSGLAHYRQRKRMSQNELARSAGIPAEYISRMETGSMIPTAKQLDTLCTILETQPHLLFDKHLLASIAERAKS